MDMTYNNLRGIEQFKNKLTLSLQQRNFSKNDIDACIEKAIDLFGDKIGVMPVCGQVSAKTAVAEIEKRIDSRANRSLLDVIGDFSLNEIVNLADVSASAQPQRLLIDDVRKSGQSEIVQLDEEAQAIYDSVRSTDSFVEVQSYNPDGSARTFNVSSVDMIDYIEEEDLTDEGKRNRGFLPSDFDSTDVLIKTASTESTESTSLGRNRTIGYYGHEADGGIYIQCPSCFSKDAIPMGAGSYMCLSCEPETTFEVDLLLDDINPEMN